MAEIAHTLDETEEPSLYDEDFFAWTQAQGALLRRLRLPGLDARNVAEEIEDLGSSQRDAIESNLGVVLLHLLKWQFQPAKRKGGWQSSVIEHRHRIAKQLRKSPSLHGYPGEVLAEEYETARRKAAAETELPPTTFPETCPYTVEQVLDDDFWPGPALDLRP